MILTLSRPNFRRHLSSVFFFFFFFFCFFFVLFCFCFNKLLLGKKFICKVERLNVKQLDPDETAHYEPSHLDLCCLQKPIIIA